MLPLQFKTPTQKKNRIIQIEVTTRCDKACSNCTRALAQVKKPDMTLEQFEQAVTASRDWIIRENGTLSLFGGNPAISKNFIEYCRILARYLPPKNRGLWCNNLLGKGSDVSKYFTGESMFNFNVHQDAQAAQEFREWFPYAQVFGEHAPSFHSSIFIASSDYLPEEEWRKKVQDCQYDIHWSAIIITEAPDWSKLGGYSCEIAATHARTNGQALGVEVVPGWLDLQRESFEEQYEYACRRCSGCLGVEGTVDLGPGMKDEVSKLNLNLVQLTISKTRTVEVVDQLKGGRNPIDYLRKKA